MSMPPPGHPAHPEMAHIYGPGALGRPRSSHAPTPISPDEQARLEAQAAIPLERLIDMFVHEMGELGNPGAKRYWDIEQVPKPVLSKREQRQLGKARSRGIWEYRDLARRLGFYGDPIGEPLHNGWDVGTQQMRFTWTIPGRGEGIGYSGFDVTYAVSTDGRVLVRSTGDTTNGMTSRSPQNARTPKRARMVDSNEWYRLSGDDRKEASAVIIPNVWQLARQFGFAARLVP